MWTIFFEKQIQIFILIIAISGNIASHHECMYLNPKFWEFLVQKCLIKLMNLLLGILFLKDILLFLCSAMLSTNEAEIKATSKILIQRHYSAERNYCIDLGELLFYCYGTSKFYNLSPRRLILSQTVLGLQTSF